MALETGVVRESVGHAEGMRPEENTILEMVWGIENGLTVVATAIFS